MATYFPVNAPDIEEYEHGIVRSATVHRSDGSNPETSRWEDGVAFVNGDFVIGGLCFDCDEPMDKSVEQTCSAASLFKPFLLEFGVTYAANGNVMGDLPGVIEEAMRVGSSARIEDLMTVGCTGGAVDNPTLTEGVSVGSGTAPVALGLIIQSFYDADAHTAAKGTIYMSPTVAVGVYDLVNEVDGVLRTKFGGHKVIVGNYPTGNMYGHTGDVDLYLSEIFVYSSTDTIRDGNNVEYRVERVAMPVWNPNTAVKATVS